MTRQEIADEVVLHRFGEGKRSSVNRWISLRYSQVNGMEAWPWVHPFTTALAVTGGTSEYEVAYAAPRLLTLVNKASEYQLQYLPHHEFAQRYLVDDPGTGEPEHYTVLAGALSAGEGAAYTIVLGPVPDADQTYTVTHFTRPDRLEADDDEPLWPPSYHYALVLGAMATGLKVENDPTWEALEEEFGVHIAAMREEVLPPHQPSTRQYGRDTLGDEGFSWL